MPELYFKGKEFVYNHHLTVPFRPLVPDAKKSCGDDPENLIIQGDNLHALKSLLPRYAGKVDLVFIDPPYNTGNEGWAYNDNVNSPLIKEWLNGNPVNSEDMLRHDKWLCMMWPRLKLLHELLSERGSIWITLDDNEQHHARAILDEVFGEQNFVANIAWHARESVQNDTDISTNNLNHVIVYAKNRRKTDRRLKEKNAATWFTLPSFVVRPLGIDEGRYSNSDNDPRGDWKADPFDAPNVRDNLDYEIENPNTGVKYRPPAGRCWRTEEPKYKALLKDGRIVFGKTGEARPQLKVFAKEKEDFGEVETTWWDGPATTTDGVKELDRIIPGHDFDNPKPSQLLQKIIHHACDRDALILDSFAGSGTTAHAVLAQNAKDSGNRKFILVECEAYADTLTAERVRRVINGYEFSGTQREELLRQKLTFSQLKKANQLLDQVALVEQQNEHRFDKIKATVNDGELVVTGEKAVAKKAEGLGGGFTYCTLGDKLELDDLLTGKSLPSFEAFGGYLFHTATGQPLDAARMREADGYLGESAQYHVWLVYRPELDYLKSRDAALTLSLAEQIAATAKDKPHLVFAPARFVPQKKLLELGVEHAPLPYALYRIEKG